MSLAAKIKKLEDVDEALRKLYREDKDGGGFVLDVEQPPSGGDESRELKKKLDDFRENNRKLAQTIQEMRTDLDKVKGIDPKKYEEAVGVLERISQDEEGELLKKGKSGMEEVLARRTQRMRADFEAKLSAAEKKAKAADEARADIGQRYSGMLIEKHVTNTVSKVGSPRPGALNDILNRARSMWSVDDEDKLVAKDAKGEPIVGAKGEPITLDEWAASLVQDAPYLFEVTGGGGARGKQGAPQGGRIRVDGTDPFAVGANLKEIAAGKASVVVGQ